MRISLKWLLPFALFSSVASANMMSSKVYEEGVDYKVVPHAEFVEGEVTEIFSFLCIHCYRMEDILKPLHELGEIHGYEIGKSHVDFLGGGRALQMALTKTYAVAKYLDAMEVVDDIFKHLHVNKAEINGQSDLQAFFTARGYKDDEVSAAYMAPEVLEHTQDMQALQMKLVQRRLLTGTPTFLVGNKYIIVNDSLSGLSKEDTIDALDALFQYLLMLK